MKLIPLTPPIIERLKSMELFALLNPAGLAHLLSRVKIVKIAEETLVLKCGTLGKELCIILEGEASVWNDEGGDIVEYAQLGSDDLFGEMSALMNTPRSANVSAKTELLVAVLLKDDIQELLKISPSFKEFLSQLGLQREEENLEHLF